MIAMLRRLFLRGRQQRKPKRTLYRDAFGNVTAYVSECTPDDLRPGVQNRRLTYWDERAAERGYRIPPKRSRFYGG